MLDFNVFDYFLIIKTFYKITISSEKFEKLLVEKLVKIDEN